MKILTLVTALVILSGCTSLEELYADAQLTGDWSKVEKREQAILAREQREAGEFKCPQRQVAYCHVDTFRKKECMCVSQSQVQQALRSVL